MTRKLSLIALNVQAGLLLCGILIAISGINNLLPDVFENFLFRSFAFTFLFLSPFGVMSAWLSIGVRFAFKYPLHLGHQVSMLYCNPVLKFLIWREVQSEISEGLRNERHKQDGR